MALHREKSVVRFETRVDYIDRTSPSQTTRTSTKLFGTQTSSLSLLTNNHTNRAHRLTHQYIPRLHRQATEIPKTTPLGSALKQFTQSCLHGELSVSEKVSALEELKTMMNHVTKSISRNLFGLQFSPPIYALGFSHWQSQPEKRVLCYLPIRLPKATSYPLTSDKVLLQLPRRFPPNMNIEPKDLEGFRSGNHKFTSSRKLYSLVIRILKRILLMKSVESERINFSLTQCVMEINLSENCGWVGEIIPCVVSGNSDSIMYTCKPFFEPPTRPFSTDDNTRNSQVNSLEFNDNEKDPNHAILDSSRRYSLRTQESVALPLENLDTVTNCSLTLPGSEQGERDEDLLSCRSDFSNKTNKRTERGSSRNTNNHGPKSNNANSANVTTDSTSTMENMSDIHWYPCNPQSENNVFETVSKTDGGVRMTAMLIVCKLAQHDWRLLSLRCYDVQTAMFHDVEHRLDHSPRWQRDSLEHCVRSLLSKLHKFTRRGSGKTGLPHFSVNGVNLWSHWDQKQLQLAQSALGRLASTDTSLVSLVCRAGGISVEDWT